MNAAVDGMICMTPRARAWLDGEGAEVRFLAHEGVDQRRLDLEPAHRFPGRQGIEGIIEPPGAHRQEFTGKPVERRRKTELARQRDDGGRDSVIDG